MSQKRKKTPSETREEGPDTRSDSLSPVPPEAKQQKIEQEIDEATCSSMISPHSSMPFRIRTLDRRHIDFDEEFDLSDVNSEKRTKFDEPFFFIQAADSQFGMIDSFVHKKQEPGWQEEMELCEQLIDTCLKMNPRPKFLVICGDLVDAWPQTQRELRHEQMNDFKRIFAKLDNDIPLVCVCGNHDIGNEPTMKTVLDYKESFGDDYFYFTTNEVLFIVINSQFYQHRANLEDYASEQDVWLENLLEHCKFFKYTIIFEHIPWFLVHPNEDDDYFNIKVEVRLKWLKKFNQAGVNKIFCGHYHRNAGGWYEKMEVVTTTAIGAQMGWDKSGVRLVRVLDSSIEHDYYPMSEIPKKVELAS